MNATPELGEMGWRTFVEILAKLFCLLSSPPFSLVYPVYASARAIESDSYSKNQQCLACWVLFALILILEMLLAELLKWIPFWPYVKGVATIFLTIPSVHGASYVYMHFISAYFLENSHMRNILFIPRKKDFISCITDSAHTNNVQDGLEELENSICQESLEPACENAKMDYYWPTDAITVREWSCALCQVKTTSEKCLKKHLQGKKHRIREQELKAYALGAKTTKNCLFSPNKTNHRMVLWGNFNQLAAAKPMMWCRWQKPEFGWTKLNTDGSVDPENAGLGGLLRDYNGEPICAFVSKAHCDDTFLVELLAVWRGLVLASGLGIKVLWVESDSESVVETINRQRPFSPKAVSCLKNIWRLLNNLEMCHISHTWRETNKAADYLSKMVLMGNDVVLWPADFPDNLWNIIKDDAEGKMYSRGLNY